MGRQDEDWGEVEDSPPKEAPEYAKTIPRLAFNEEV
jgi:hypothetical protein